MAGLFFSTLSLISWVTAGSLRDATNHTAIACSIASGMDVFTLPFNMKMMVFRFQDWTLDDEQPLGFIVPLILFYTGSRKVDLPSEHLVTMIDR